VIRRFTFSTVAAIAITGCANGGWNWTTVADSITTEKTVALPVATGEAGDAGTTDAPPDPADSASTDSASAGDGASADSGSDVGDGASSSRFVWWRTDNGVDPNGQDAAVDVAIDPNGRVVVLACMAGNAFGLLAYDADGTLAWMSSYRNPADDADLPTKIAIDGAGNVYAAGSWQENNSPLGGFLVASFDPTGALRWSARSDAGGALADFAVDGAGHVVVTGNGSDGTHTLARTIEYDNAGNVIWAASELGPFGLGASGFAVAVDSNAQVYVAGQSSDGSHNHVTLFAYNPSGTLLWASASPDDPVHVPQTTAQAVALDLAGTPHVAVARAFRETPDDDPVVQLALNKYDASGQISWTAIVDPETRNIATAMAIDPQGRVTVTGFAGSPSPDSYLTAQVDSTGQVLWTDRCAWQAPGQHEARGLALDGAGNAYVTGTAYGSDGVARFGTIGYDPNGQALFRELDGDPSNASSLAATLAVDPRGGVYVVGSVLSDPRGVVGLLKLSH
jgi:hypothetical protein